MAKVLWMVNHYAGLPHEPGGTRHFRLSQGLTAQGWDVRLLRSGPAAARPWAPDVEVVDGVEVTTLQGPPAQARGRKRIVGWAQFSAELLDPRTTRRLPKPDVVIGSTVHLGAAWAARSLARRHGVPFVFEVRDLWPETLIALGALERSSPAARAMRRVERSLARSADLIVSPLAGAGRYFSEQHGVPETRFRWVSNGVALQSYRDIADPAPGQLKLQYFGAVGTANDVELIVDALARANQALDEPVRLQIRGSGPSLPSLAARVGADPALCEVVTFEPPVAASSVPAAMSWGNGLVMTVRDLPDLYKYGISMNKLFDYVASGRWIVMASDVPENPIGAAPGLTTCAPSVEAMAEAIQTVARLAPEERDSIARGNVDLARDQFDYTVLADTLDDALRRVVVDRQR